MDICNDLELLILLQQNISSGEQFKKMLNIWKNKRDKDVALQERVKNWMSKAKQPDPDYWPDRMRDRLDLNPEKNKTDVLHARQKQGNLVDAICGKQRAD